MKNKCRMQILTMQKLFLETAVSKKMKCSSCNKSIMHQIISHRTEQHQDQRLV